MEIVIAAVVVALGLAAGLVIAAGVLAKRSPGVATAATQAPAGRPVPPAVTPQKSPQLVDGNATAKLVAREETLDKRTAELADRERRLGDRERQIEDTREKAVRALERASGLSASQAKALLLKELEDQVRHDSARRVRAIEEETKRDAERRVRNILSVVMQRLAAGHAAETTV
jgi:ribonucrease Y